MSDSNAIKTAVNCHGADQDSQYLCDPADLNSCEACQRVHELRDEIDALEAKIKERRNTILNLKAEANYNHSKLTHQLPLEITGAIFELCLHQNPMDINLVMLDDIPLPTIFAPWVLSAVCKWWRTVVQSTPQLWKNIILPCPSESLDNDDAWKTMPFLVQKWVDYSATLPLSVNFYASMRASTWTRFQIETMEEIIRVLNQSSSRWRNLKLYGSPAFLSHISIRGLPQLRTLNWGYLLDDDDEPYVSHVDLEDTQITELTIWARMDLLLNLDWTHLTTLTMVMCRPSDCLKALQKATNLLRFIVQLEYHSAHDESAFQYPTIHLNVQHIEIADTDLCTVLDPLSCPKLKSLVLDQDRSEETDLNIVSFLTRSGCLLEELSLTLDQFDISQLALEMRTLLHLNLKFCYHVDPCEPLFEGLFALLSKFSDIDRKPEPQYFPSLISLSIACEADFDYDPLSTLPSIFGARGSGHATEIHRHPLKSVSIVWPGPYESIEAIDEDTMARLLWLRDFADVQWKIEYGEGLDRMNLVPK